MDYRDQAHILAEYEANKAAKPGIDPSLFKSLLPSKAKQALEAHFVISITREGKLYTLNRAIEDSSKLDYWLQECVPQIYTQAVMTRLSGKS